MLSTLGLCSILSGCFIVQVLGNGTTVCNTTACVSIAQILKTNLDKSVNPCDDFYHFACGGFLKTENVEGYKASSTYFNDISSIFHNQIVTMLLRPENPNDLRSFKMVKRLFDACMNEDSINKRGTSFFLELLKKAGGWPLLDGEKWDESKFHWLDMIYKLHELNLGGGNIIGFKIVTDISEPLRRVIQIGEISFPIPRDDMMKGRNDKKAGKLYEMYMTDITELFGAFGSTATAERIDVLDFETELAKIYISDEDSEDITKVYNPMHIRQLKEKYPFVNWDQYLRKMMNNIIEPDPDELVVVHAPSYLEKLQKLIESTTNRTLANVIVWRTLLRNVEFLTKDFEDKKFKFHGPLTQVNFRPPRLDQCIDLVKNGLIVASGAMYVRSYFSEAKRKEAVDLVERIRKEMIKDLEELDWMDALTKQQALLKARTMRLQVAYPIELLQDDKIEKVHARLEITGETFFESVKNMTRFVYEDPIRQLRQRIDKTDWRKYGSVFNADVAYHPFDNSMDVPVVILENPYFSIDRPKYMNYGSMGFGAASTLTHAFDFDTGSTFDETGRIRHWWTKKTEEDYSKKVIIMIEQAQNYKVQRLNMKINGSLTHSEIAGDIAGAKLSYHAYNSWRAVNHEEPRLQGLEEYTPRQTFWLSAANCWCVAYSKESIQIMENDASYVPPEYRVNGAFKNQESFSKDFSCPLGSKMNPVLKSNIW